MLRTHVDSPVRLLSSLQSGALDIAILYSPHRRPGVETAPILEEELIPVGTERCAELTLEKYVYVDWGPDFASTHDSLFPELAGAATRIGLGPLALRYLLQIGGCGYFRTRAVEPYIAQGRLFRITNAPPISYSLYAATSEQAAAGLLDWAKTSLIEAARCPSDDWA